MISTCFDGCGGLIALFDWDGCFEYCNSNGLSGRFRSNGLSGWSRSNGLSGWSRSDTCNFFESYGGGSVGFCVVSGDMVLTDGEVAVDCSRGNGPDAESFASNAASSGDKTGHRK
jgi:hypothetical protein